ncbi:hypothetical protein, partial [Arenibacter sp. S6351L]|uniref:hypothetical protein n=1 Tax=Arenibacter sp. S6351L TaxID=2926407 RepID=UPI001FF6C8CE
MLWVAVPLSPQKETHNESYGFFVSCSLRSLLRRGGRKQKTNKRQLVMVCMLARDCLIGMHAVNPF